MSKRYKAKRRARYHRRTRTCCRCGEHAIECRLYAWEEPFEMLCGTHAREAGYCPGCGLFWAGVESYEFSGSGLCEHCAEQVRADAGEFDEGEGDCDYEREWCDACGNLGYVNCYCGGDLCVCANNGEVPCEVCA